SFKASALPNEIVLQYLKHRCGNWKNQYFYGIIIGELNEASKEPPSNDELLTVLIEHSDDNKITAFLKDQKPQCIVITASTTTLCNEVNHIVKEGANSSVIKFTRPKVFYEYSCSKGAIDINNQ
ncbi:4627_t:CDS:2, partial [Racocetra fulgida]